MCRRECYNNPLSHTCIIFFKKKKSNNGLERLDSKWLHLIVPTKIQPDHTCVIYLKLAQMVRDRESKEGT